MRKIVFLAMTLFSISVIAGIEEDKVLEDWAIEQKNYPQTTLFEKIDKSTYRLKNEGFGFDGKITVKNVIIENSTAFQGKTADIIVDLATDEEALYDNFGKSYSRWTMSNSLVYDDNQGKWVRYNNLTYKSKKNCKSTKAKRGFLQQLFIATFPVVLVVVMIMLIFWRFMRSLNKGGKNINERILDSNLEIANQLKRIADNLDKND